jgi:putative Mg2+ transporter-C (MgtC) family protein
MDFDTILATVADEFSDVGDTEQFTRVAVRLVIAALLGGVLGLQREHQGKSAGVRTHMLVSLGAAVFVMVPQLAGVESDSLARVIQGIVAGIGFLGAGSILKPGGDHVRGLTTAAGIWLTAAIGVGVGLGRVMTAALSVALALLILLLQGPLERLAGSRDRGGQDRD